MNPVSDVVADDLVVVVPVVLAPFPVPVPVDCALDTAQIELVKNIVASN